MIEAMLKCYHSAMKRRYLYFRLFICVLVGFIPLPGVERLFFDLLTRTQWQKPTDFPLTVLEFDRIALLDAHSRLVNQNLKLRDSALRPSDYPSWDDLVMAQMLLQLRKAEPTLVVVTYPFPSTIDDSRTRLTADAVRKLPSVWASRLPSEGEIEYPPSTLTPFNNYGFSNFFSDSDGVVRRADLFHAGHVHLGLRALRELGHSIYHLNLDEPQLISFGYSTDKLPTLSLPQVLFQPVETWEKWVKNRIVLVGINAANLSPILTSKGEYSRAQMHAVLMTNLLSEKGFIREFPYWADVLLTLFMLALTVFITFNTSVTWAGTLVFLQGVSLCGITYLIFNTWGLWVQMAAPLFTIIITYSLLTHYQLITEEDLRYRAMQEAENLRKVDELKSNFKSLFSHDLKTPTAKIDAICDRVLKNDTAKAKVAELLKDFNLISECNQELKGYIHNILQLTRVESRNVRLQRTVCDLNHIIENTVNRVQPLAHAKGISLSMELEPLFSMELDEDMVRESLQNVLVNAINYCHEGAIVVVRSKEQDHSVVIVVQDNGPGIEKKDLERVTEKFFRGQAATAHRGSGLGLYLVKYFTELHGGHLAIQSRKGHGTSVEMRFPVEI